MTTPDPTRWHTTGERSFSSTLRHDPACVVCQERKLTRVELHDALVPLMGFEETAYAFQAIDESGEVRFDKHGADGTVHYLARYNITTNGDPHYSLTTTTA